MKTFLRLLAGLVVALCLAPRAGAQVVDDVDIRRDGADAVVQVRFATDVRFSRSVVTRSGDLVQVFYEIIGAAPTDAPRSSALRRLGAADGLPTALLSDEPDRGERNRKLVLRLDTPTRVLARAGRGSRTIELVFPGMGSASARAAAGPSAVTPPPAPALPAVPAPPRAGAPAAAAAPAPAGESAADRRFMINLQRSAQPDLQLAQPVPSSVQDYQVFSSRRVIDGATLYEINLGYFATRTQAEQALRAVRGRFPQAAIVALEAAPAVPVAAAPRAAVPVAPAASAPVAVPPAVPSAVRPAVPPASAPALAALPPAAPASAAAPAVPAVPAVPLPAPTGTAAAAPAPAVASEPPLPSADAIEARAAVLYESAQRAYAARDYASATVDLNELLNLPPNTRTRDGQELAGMARLKAGDTDLARAEFETYLALYPRGPGAERVRRELAALPPKAATPAAQAQPARAPVARAAGEEGVSGSTAMYFFGGNGRVRSQDFKDSPLSGLPEATGEPLLAPDTFRQVYNDIDLAWRMRDDEQDLRFVLRDNYTTDLENRDKSRNRLGALYVDYRAIADGYSLRLGRQSPTGAGNFNRFDGVQLGYADRRRYKVGAIAGRPSEPLFDAKRYFVGVSGEVENLVGGLGVGGYVNQQMIDGEVDRRTVGVDLRYFRPNLTVFSQLDYDVYFKGVNIASVQGTWIVEEGTTVNLLVDRRMLTPLALGNALTFSDTGVATLARNINERLGSGSDLDALREQVKQVTPRVTQAQVGLTTQLTRQWQLGANAQLTNTGAIAPVPSVAGFENGVPATGNIVTLGLQFIGLNLYSPRDTSVLGLSSIRSPNLDGWIVTLNNSSVVWDDWQLEPSLQWYRDRTPLGGSSQRLTPGLRLTYRGLRHWSVESAFTAERGRATRVSLDVLGEPVTTKETSNRVNYSLGARYEF